MSIKVNFLLLLLVSILLQVRGLRLLIQLIPESSSILSGFCVLPIWILLLQPGNNILAVKDKGILGSAGLSGIILLLLLLLRCFLILSFTLL